jgi:hypothetical protein
LSGTGGTSGVPSGFSLIHIVYVSPGFFDVVEIFGAAMNASRSAVFPRPQPLDTTNSTYAKTYVCGTLWDGVHGKCLAEGRVDVVTCDVIVPANALIDLGPHFFNRPDPQEKMNWATASGSLAGSIAIYDANWRPIQWRIAGPFADTCFPAFVVELTSPAT